MNNILSLNLPIDHWGNYWPYYWTYLNSTIVIHQNAHSPKYKIEQLYNWKCVKFHITTCTCIVNKFQDNKENLYVSCSSFIWTFYTFMNDMLIMSWRRGNKIFLHFLRFYSIPLMDRWYAWIKLGLSWVRLGYEW